MLTPTRPSKMKKQPVHWDPLLQRRIETPGVGADVLRTPLGSAAHARMNGVLRYAGYGLLVMIALMTLPQLVFMMAFMSGAADLGLLLGVLLFGLAVRFLASRRKHVSVEATAEKRARLAVATAAADLDLSAKGTISLERLATLRTLLGDVHAALGFPDGSRPDLAGNAPDEFQGQMPDGSPLWCLLKKSDVLLASIPEHHRRGRQPSPESRATALSMLMAFPLTRQTGFRLEILHRVMQVIFARVATTIDIGSTEFNNRFLVAASAQADALAVHRAVTPALQAVLIEFFDRFWLVNVVVDDDTVFVSAVDFHHEDGDAGPAAHWVETMLADIIARTARIRNYID